MERVAASHKLHVLVARRFIVGKVLPPIDGHLEPRLPFVDQDLCKEAIIPAVTAIFRVMSRVELCAVGLPTTRTCAQQCCARSVVPEHWCWAIGTTHWRAGDCRVRLLGSASVEATFSNGMNHIDSYRFIYIIHSRITCPSGYMFGRIEFACRSFRLCIKWIVIAARQRWRWRLSSRGLTGHCAADQPARPGIPPSAVGVAFRAGSGRKARDGPYKLFNCYVDRAGVPTAQFESRRVLLRLTSSTIEYMRLSDRVPMYRTVTSGPERT